MGGGGGYPFWGSLSGDSSLFGVQKGVPLFWETPIRSRVDVACTADATS